MPRRKNDSTRGWPAEDQLAVMRAWLEGVDLRAAVDRFAPHRVEKGRSPRPLLSAIRKQLCALADSKLRPDIAQSIREATPSDPMSAASALRAIELLRHVQAPQPLLGDDVRRWFPEVIAEALRGAGINDLAGLVLQMSRRRRWWSQVVGLGAARARAVSEVVDSHPQLKARADAIVSVNEVGALVPWERLVTPEDLNGTKGTFRAPLASCALDARDDYQAVQAWLSLHESQSTQRSYRKEAERLILWSITERGKALSSLTTEDAVAYRSFLRRPTPAARWTGPPQPRSSTEWRPFAGALSPRSTSYALSVLNALYRWLIEKRYVLANPFAGVKVRGVGKPQLDAKRAFSESEWKLLRTIADGLEWSYGWSKPAAQRLRFALDFAYSTGLRAGEFVGAKLGAVETDSSGDVWITVIGKGSKAGRVSLPPLAREALDSYMLERRLPVSPERWDPATPVLASLSEEDAISGSRFWQVMRRFFDVAASAIDAASPALAAKLRTASPHWMRHTHATHLLDSGAELTSVRDNLRHASLATTSLYLHTDDVRRAKQIAGAFRRRD